MTGSPAFRANQGPAFNVSGEAIMKPTMSDRPIRCAGTVFDEHKDNDWTKHSNSAVEDETRNRRRTGLMRIVYSQREKIAT